MRERISTNKGFYSLFFNFSIISMPSIASYVLMLRLFSVSGMFENFLLTADRHCVTEYVFVCRNGTEGNVIQYYHLATEPLLLNQCFKDCSSHN